MNKFLKVFLTLGLIATSAQAQAWTQLAKCGTGDALEGMDVFTDGENIIVQVLSYEEIDGQDQTVVNEYRTNNGMGYPVEVNVDDVVEMLASGETISYVVTKEDTFAFGGVENNAALLRLKLNPADSNHPDHYTSTSLLAFEGQVAHFFCY